MMYFIIVGNILALIGSVFMILASASKDNKGCVLYQSIQIFMFILSNIVLGGLTGVIINALSFIRNLLSYKNKLNKVNSIIILSIIIVLTILFNNLGVIGYLPLVGTIVFTAFINSKSVSKFKISLGFSIVMWLIYDVYIKSYSSAIFDFFSLSASLISIIQINKLSKKKNSI